MFEKEIEFIYKYNLNKIKHLGSFITYEQLISTNIHPALLQYLSAEIDFLIYEDRQKLLKDSLFDYSGDKIVEYFSNIGEEIKRNKKFSYEYLSKLLLHASSFNVNFIVRPKWSLMQFVFENENESTKQIIEVKQILNYLYFYPYLKRLLINFFNKKRLIAISNSELKEVLDKIDKINYESNFEKVLDSALTSIAEFIYMGEVQNKKTSKQFVELFLADKGLSHLETILAEKFGASTTDKHDIAEFQKVIIEYISEDNLLDDEIENSEKIESHFDDNQNEDIANSVNENSSISEEAETTEDNDERGKPDYGVLDEVVESQSEEEETEAEDESEELDSVMSKEEEPNNEKKKSFLETHIESVEEDSDDADEDLPPDFDEATRTDEENIEEIYGLAVEEKTIDSVVDDEVTLPRVEIIDNEDNSFENEIDISTDENTILYGVTDEEANSHESGFVEQGTSVTYKSEELTPSDNDVEIDEEEKNIDDVEKEIDDWPSESSQNESEVGISNLSDNIADGIEEENNSEENNSTVMDEIDALLDDGADVPEDNTLSQSEVHEGETKIEDTQQMLFDESELDSTLDENEEAEDEEVVEDTEVAIDEPEQSIDISLLLENKKITKIIEVVFDYDMEEFANAIDKISECRSETEAHTAIDEIARRNFVGTTNKEIKIFKNIISEYFK